MYRAKQRLLSIFLVFATLLLTAVLGIVSLFDTTKTVRAAEAAYYVKVTAAPDDWSGNYLIVYEGGSVAFNGSLTTLDAANNNTAVTISDGKIEATDAMKAIQFTITKNGSNYTIKSASDYYIGATGNSNSLLSNTSTQYTNTITLDTDGNVNIIGSGGAYLRYNASSNNYRFRYYKSSSYTGQKAIQLYKYTESTTESPACSHTEYTAQYYENNQHIEKCKECGEIKADAVAQDCTYGSYTYTPNNNGTHIKKGTCTTCQNEATVATDETCNGSNWGIYTTENGVHSRTGNCTLCGASVTESGECEISAEYVREGNQHTQTGTCNICSASTSVTEDCTLTTDGYAPLDTDNKAEQQHAITTTCSVCEKTATANESCSFDEGVLEGSTRTYTCQHCEYSYSEEVTLYTVSYIVSGETAPESQPVVANETVTLPNGDDYNEYTFVGWTTESLNGETNEAPDYTKAGDTYEVTKDVTFYALYSKTESTGDWTKVTDVNKLAVGYEIVIVASGSDDALSTTQNTSNRASVAITKNGDTVTINDSVQIITLETGTVDDAFAFKVDGGYLYAASSSANNLKTKTALDDNGSWAIEIDGDGVATIQAKGSYTRNLLRKNSSSALFSCYGSGQNDVSIYMKDTTTSYVTAEGTCEHTYEIDEENSQPKTCTENGVEIKICTKCGDRNEETLFATGHVEVHTIISEATCKVAGSKTITCENCSELNETIELPILPHDYQGGKCTACGEILPAQATLTFDDKAKRTEFTTEKQVWTENSIILTNDKAESTNNVADYANPARFYKSSTITIEYPQMFVIVFTCNTAAYAEALKTSIGDTATSNGKSVTVKFAEPQDSFTITMSEQVRMDSLTVATEPTINSASVTIREDITLNCYVTIADTLYADATLVFTMNGNNLDVKGELTDGRYKFSLELPPQYMTDTVQIFLYYGSDEIEKIENYSIQNYAKNQLDKAGDNTELKRLISDMLHYGAAAQIYKDYNVENLANNVDGILAETADVPTTTDFTLSEVANDCPAYFTGAGVHFDNVNKLYVKLSTTENVTLTINGTQVENLSTKIYTDGISVTSFDETHTFVLSYDDGNGQTATQTLTYSINAYAYAKKDAENVAMKNLALALYRYGVSAEAYAA